MAGRAPEVGESPLAARLALASVVLAIVPIAVATVRGIARGWLPIGDNAFFAIRAADVLTRHHPLLGTWTSASLSVGRDVNNPGPLLFDWLAAGRPLGPAAGIAVATALLNTAAVVGIAVFAHRRGGPLLTTAAMVVTAGLTWAMGSEILYEPWQPHSLLIPFLLFVVLVWSVSCGDLVALPWAAGVGSFVLQTHLSYALLVPALSIWALVGLAVTLWDRRRREPGEWPRLRRRAVRLTAVAVAVFAACWAQSVVEQLTSNETGNLTRLADSAGQRSQTIGLALGARILAKVVALPPWWLRPSFSASLTEPHLPSLALALSALVLTGLVLALCAWVAVRGRDGRAWRAVATAAIALVVGLATAERAPTGTFGIAAHQFRFIWPVAAFVTLAVVVTALRPVARRPARAGRAVVVLAALAAVLAALNLPTSNQGVGPSSTAWAIEPSRDIGRQVGSLAGQGPFLMSTETVKFADPYNVYVMYALQQHGIPFVVREESMTRQLGPSRRFTGANARAVMSFATGDGARQVPPGGRVVALHEGLDPVQRNELAVLRARITDHIRQVGLRLNGRGQSAVRRGDLPPQLAQPGADPEGLMVFREIVAAVEGDGLLIDPGWKQPLARYAELQRRADDQTVAVFLQPLPAPPRP